jgi:hypothetical protein
VKLTEVSLEEIELSVAMTTPASNSSAVPPVAWPAVIVAVAVRFVESLNRVFATTVGPTGVRANAVGTFGARVSTTSALFAPSEPAVPGAIRVSEALLPAASLMVPPASARAEVEAISRSLELSPACTVYRKVRVVVPEPDT